MTIPQEPQREPDREAIARNLGYTDGWNAATAAMGEGALPEPRRRRSRGRQLTGPEWAAYQAGWAEALDDYGLEGG